MAAILRTVTPLQESLNQEYGHGTKCRIIVIPKSYQILRLRNSVIASEARTSAFPSPAQLLDHHIIIIRRRIYEPPLQDDNMAATPPPMTHPSRWRSEVAPPIEPIIVVTQLKPNRTLHFVLFRTATTNVGAKLVAVTTRAPNAETRAVLPMPVTALFARNGSRWSHS